MDDGAQRVEIREALGRASPAQASLAHAGRLDRGVERRERPGERQSLTSFRDAHDLGLRREGLAGGVEHGVQPRVFVVGMHEQPAQFGGGERLARIHPQP